MTATVLIDPAGSNVAVTVTRAPDGHAMTGYSDAACTVAVTWPATISSATKFYFPHAGRLRVSGTVNGQEVLGPVDVDALDDTPQVIKVDPDSAAFVAALASPAVAVAITTQSADYTLALTDAGTEVEGTKATAQTFTVPPNSSVAFPVGTVVNVRQMGAGQITVAAGAGVTLRAPNGAKTSKQYSTVGLIQRAQDEWVVSGDTTT